MVVCYAIFYISTVFALDYGTRVAHIPRGVFLQVLCAGIVAMGIVTPVSALLSDRFGCRPVLLAGSALAAASGFALAPLLGLWFGFGIASKVVMAVLVIFFPVTAAFSDGLRRTEPGWLDLARTMDARPLAVLRHVRLPAAMPAFGSGRRIAAAIAPIGAVIGEWVGASAGLGYVMLNANARMETDVMFAALFMLALMTVLLWALVDGTLRRVLRWSPDTRLRPLA